MIIRAKGEHARGYRQLSDLSGEMLMDFGVLRMKKGEQFSDDFPLERAFLLVYGEVTFEWPGGKETVLRADCFNVPPTALHVSKGAKVLLTAVSDDCEINVLRTENEKTFPARLYTAKDTPDEYRGAGLMNETSTRIVRTIFDDSNAKDANLVLGEVIGFPGKWSSYPPHHHPQPEIYYYKTFPENGFAYAELGEEVVKVRNNDAVFIGAGLTHPHCTAPGYALWYLWAIRHLPENRYGTPTFLPEHLWVLEKDAKFWPEG